VDLLSGFFLGGGGAHPPDVGGCGGGVSGADPENQVFSGKIFRRKAQFTWVFCGIFARRARDIFLLNCGHFSP